ncbi:MAG: TlpA family protein disulfide reductase [Alphaproteobacteria bacterium]|nr:TlpA family protein disulfide reductase [Alphaproteobacteria bacterium]
MQNFSFFDPPKAAPDITFIDAEGRELGLRDFRGKFVLVNLWATWCSPCRREMPSLDRLQSRLGGGDFTVLALSQDRKGPDAVAKFLAEIRTENLDVYVDTSARSARRLGAIGLPTTVLLDRDGQIIGRLIGSAEWDSDEAAHLIKTVIRESARKTAANRL